ncbi:Pimeloyl-ACP methyl ester carboxylesterase [Ruminococcus sp. YE71]|uniref:alpha/beta fold hydrolase n=1 Tax=unclassified Ruminococcus TaxID=2608920 RepID=UPI00088AE6AC|nr:MULTISPECIES: hypothetical protein [unclassified Ruminococcus]SDA20974.1 Pimeloyl-ACP methyl ester carboxylesterase [Ruminococcus sp. YE78]SFW33238.1 Pimeloyl-ACP methyl ester carboxylesterase [Ruminococcus sp. YE71]
MKFNTYGNKRHPIVIMLTSSFCSAESLEYLYSDLAQDYFVIVPEYNGHYEGSKDFTNRKRESAEIVQYLDENRISDICLIYGQSMGAEIGMELIYQLLKHRIEVESAFFDGGTFLKQPKLYKAVMNFKQKSMINKMRNQSVDEVVNWKSVDQFSKGDTETMRPIIESMVKTAPIISENSIKNETEARYTFNFPPLPEQVQENIFFVYSDEEKTFKSCFRHLIEAYPAANFKTISGYGHLTYSVEKTDDYLRVIRAICTRNQD